MLVAATSEMVYTMNADWSKMCSLLGKDYIASTERPRGDWMDAYIPESDQSLVRQAIDHAIRTRTVFELEHRVIRMDCTVGQVCSRAVPIMDYEGEIVEWFGTASGNIQIKGLKPAGHPRRTRKRGKADRGGESPRRE